MQDQQGQLHSEISRLKRRYAGSARELSRLQPWKSYCALIGDWGVIISAICLAEWLENSASYLFAMLVIAGRQHALLVLSHEGAHYRLSRSQRLNNLISDTFAAFPIFFDTKMYRENHWQHHQHTNSEKDPDWVRKIPEKQWQFPMAKSYLLGFLPVYVLYRGAKEWINNAMALSGLRPMNKTMLGKRILFWGLVSAAVTWFSVWSLFLQYWLVPFFFAFPIFQRIRSVAEHFGLAREHELNHSRNVVAPRLELFLLGPHSVNLHLTHHLFPSVPFYNLAKLHSELLLEPLYASNAHQNTSYLWPRKGVLWEDLLTDRAERAAQAGREKPAA